jgi:hypothetical protein
LQLTFFVSECEIDKPDASQYADALIKVGFNTVNKLSNVTDWSKFVPKAGDVESVKVPPAWHQFRGPGIAAVHALACPLVPGGAAEEDCTSQRQLLLAALMRPSLRSLPRKVRTHALAKRSCIRTHVRETGVSEACTRLSG